MAGAAPDKSGSSGISIMVTWPDGTGIAGIDFRITAATGAPLTGYTQDYGWSAEANPGLRVESIQLTEAIHGVVSPVFPVPAHARHFAFVLTPNDMGVADFDNAPARRDANGLHLHWRGGILHFVRQDP